MSTPTARTADAMQIKQPDSRHVDDVVASPNIGARRAAAVPRFLILHYTGLPSAARSIDVLCDPVCEVSCHYLVDLDGRITQMVREADRAWHAGLSCWHGETDINSCSIGIEIQNTGHGGDGAVAPDYPDMQMQAVEQLGGDILARHGIKPADVLAHSDIAPQRKIDPGERFDWARLHRAGIGHWVEPLPVSQNAMPPFNQAASDARVRRAQDMLSAYGYDVGQDGLLDPATQRVISAFQRHFRPARVDGLPDASTLATLENLLGSLTPT